MRRSIATRYHPRPLDEHGPPWLGLICAAVLIGAVVALYVLATGDPGRPEDPLPEPHSAPLSPGESAAAGEPSSPAAAPIGPAASSFDDLVVDDRELAELLAVSLNADDPLRQVLTVELLTRTAIEVCPTIPEHLGTVEQLAAWLEAAAATPVLDAVNPRDRQGVVAFAVHYGCQARFARFAGLA